MRTNNLKPYFTYSRTQRRGIVVLLSLIILSQFLYFIETSAPIEEESPEKQQWLALQPKLDSLKTAKSGQVRTIYPFNPNFITDYKGYSLGMSVAEIDRLHTFRKQNKYVNSAAEFQKVTKVSDSLLGALSPYFKFPDWVTNKKPAFKVFEKRTETITVTDINTATADELIKVYGIGPALSDRILKQRELLGGFVDIDQIADVWGLSPEVVANVRQRFSVMSVPQVKKIKINEASVKELAQFPYFRYKLAKQIVTYRSMNGNITSTADLLKINGFPVGRAEIITLYLEF